MKKYEKVLIAIDIEDKNMELLVEKAIFICELVNPKETYIVYVNSPLAGTPSLVAGSIHEKREDVMDLEMKVKEVVPEELFHKFNTTFIVNTGDPSEEVVRLTEELNIDLVIIGKKVRSGFESFFHLKVEHKIIKNVKCDVFALDLTNKS